MNSNGLVRRLEKQLYNQNAFAKADRMERIFVYLVSGGEVGAFRLREIEKEYLALMERAYALIFEHRSVREAAKIFRKECGTKKHDWTANKVIHSAQLMFGHFEDVNKRVQRGIVRETILTRMKSTELQQQMIKADDDNYFSDYAALEKLIQGYLKQLADLDDLKSQDQAGIRDTTIPEIQFTDDPAALMENEEDAEVTFVN